MRDVLLELRDLNVGYYTKAGIARAVNGVSLSVMGGETLGLVGESGSGKSTLGLSIITLVPPPGRIEGGRILFDGEDITEKGEKEMRRIRGKEISMIFQDPMTSLDPLMRIRDHLLETFRAHENLGDREALDRCQDLLSSLGIPEDRMNDYPHQFSGGMRQRVMIGLAIALNPKLIIADEPTTALDVIVQAQILRLLKTLRRRYGMSMVIISHDVSVVGQVADRIAVMYGGQIVEVSDTMSLFEDPLHPYTQGLLQSIPNVRLSDQEIQAIPGVPPDLIRPPTGCRFHPRCPHAMEICRNQVPETFDVDGRGVRCFLHDGESDV